MIIVKICLLIPIFQLFCLFLGSIQFFYLFFKHVVYKVPISRESAALHKNAILLLKKAEQIVENYKHQPLHYVKISTQPKIISRFLLDFSNGYHFDTSLLLSVFLGMFGADRFYLGYPAIGLLKFCTLGFMFLGQLVDVILIATQVVGPADGSAYVIPYYGPGITVVRSDNWTYRLPQDNW